jgi:redox-sensitive bicupin YhaK (pirin superfamily)
LQCWIALPEARTEMEPSFIHVGRAKLPYIHREKLLMRLIAGEAYGYTSPVKTYSPMFYLDTITETGAEVERPCGQSETACYVISGKVQIGDQSFEAGQFVMLEDEPVIHTLENSRYFLLGGIKFEKQPILRWNFLAYSEEKIKEAEQRWREGKFPSIPGDDMEYIPLPDKGGSH